MAHCWAKRWIILFWMLPGLLCAEAWAAEDIRVPLREGVVAVNSGGRTLSLECVLPPGDAAKDFLAAYLSQPAVWWQYKDRMAVSIPFSKLNGGTQRTLLEALFPSDYADARGWWHTAVVGGETGMESLWTLCEWLTGKGTNYRIVQQHPENKDLGSELPKGRKVLVPMALLLAPFRGASAPRTPAKEEAPKVETRPLPPASPTLAPSAPEPVETPAPLETKSKEPEMPATPESAADALDASPEVEESPLEYDSDDEGTFAAYVVKEGESLNGLATRFTGVDNAAKLARVVAQVQKRSKMKAKDTLKPGMRLIFPNNLLAEKYQFQEEAAPGGLDKEIEQEVEREEAKRGRSKDLSDVVVVLDPGHGGRDQGASYGGLIEDEINYDIVCRIKALLEKQTGAKIYMTLEDKEQKYAPREAADAAGNGSEMLLTTPPYWNDRGRVSAHLRWALANALYRKELKRGTDSTKILFASIHCNKLPRTMKGAMIYVPGASYRNTGTKPDFEEFSQFEESRDNPPKNASAADCRRDEALSRLFAIRLVGAMKKNDALSVYSDPIRNIIRQSKGRFYLPAVLKYNRIPTKVLVETGNMANASDAKHLASAKWRQAMAQAFVDALTNFYSK